MGKRGSKAKRVEEAAFVEAIAACKSIACVLRMVGLVPCGGNYQRVKWVVQTRSLDTSHWTGQGHRKGNHDPIRRPRPLSTVLLPNSCANTSWLRQRLLREGILEAVCSRCRNDSWMGGPISLELDHCDGDRFNNRLENLRLLCPNCHAQTDTYRGRNKKAK